MCKAYRGGIEKTLQSRVDTHVQPEIINQKSKYGGRVQVFGLAESSAVSRPGKLNQLSRVPDIVGRGRAVI